MINPRPFPAIYELGSDFYDPVRPAVFPTAVLRYRNQKAAQEIGLESLSPSQWENHFHRFAVLPQNIQEPLALRYHGHQFQHYNPDLGDGRGFLFAQFWGPKGLLDLGTKGSGTTPYSRSGDGRLTLKGAYREILATEILESYGVNTSRTFSVFETGENLERQDEPSPTRSAVLVRLSHSHIRFGTFQRLAFLKQTDNLEKLLHHCCRHFYPQLQSLEGTELGYNFLKSVAKNCARLAAQWMMAGFVHGVLNTDNMNINGESFDYGPYRFLPEYKPGFTAAYFDRSGLYAYGRQGHVVYWNLYQLGLALQSAFPSLNIEEALDDYADEFNFSLQQELLKRLNLKPLSGSSPLACGELLVAVFQFMDQEKMLFEQCLFDLHSGAQPDRLTRSPLSDHYQRETFKPLKNLLASFEVADTQKQDHAYFAGTQPCTLLIDEIESIWKEIAEKDDWSLFEKKLQQIRFFRGLYSA